MDKKTDKKKYDNYEDSERPEWDWIKKNKF